MCGRDSVIKNGIAQYSLAVSGEPCNATEYRDNLFSETKYPSHMFLEYLLIYGSITKREATIAIGNCNMTNMLRRLRKRGYNIRTVFRRLPKGEAIYVLDADDIEDTNGSERMTRSTHPRLYFVWYNMIRRCTQKGNISYKWYGGRGVKVCEEWLNDFDSFAKWSLRNGYDESAKRGDCTLDRIEGNGNYEPTNCRWVNTKVQANNRSSNQNLTLNGETKTIAQWSEELGIELHLLYGRRRIGWSDERILTEPVARKGVK